jgi:hypothetical protein
MSNIAIGFILLQVGADGKRYPNRFGSIMLNEVESRYSQAKLELYRLFHMVRVFIFGVKCLTVEVDTKYIKGMINNPDLQPHAITINRWMVGILLFLFKLVHVSATKHKGIDGLSRRPLADEDPLDDHEDWIDRAYSFGVAILNDRTYCLAGSASEIIRHVHYNCYTPQLVRAPIHRVFLDVAQDEDTEQAIPHSEAAQVIDASLILTQQFLITRKRPADLSDHEFAVFVNHAARFFILEGNLWRREPHGRHQLVVQPHKCLCILKEVHDDLGHKSIYTTRIQLLLRFWWPHIVEDIKWYVKTCHECQTRQMCKLHIPSTVATPGGLFRKAHIDTMKMPKVGGFKYLVQARCVLTSYPEWRMLRKENTKC